MKLKLLAFPSATRTQNDDHVTPTRAIGHSLLHWPRQRVDGGIGRSLSFCANFSSYKTKVTGFTCHRHLEHGIKVDSRVSLKSMIFLDLLGLRL
jgi:hypothetical protein